MSGFENRVFLFKRYTEQPNIPCPFLSPLSPFCFLFVCLRHRRARGRNPLFKSVVEKYKLFLPIMIAVVLIKVEKDVFFSDFNSEKDFIPLPCVLSEKKKDQVKKWC
jgi:hypothetical protein